jgi:hypothetical protein
MYRHTLERDLLQSKPTFVLMLHIIMIKELSLTGRSLQVVA